MTCTAPGHGFPPDSHVPGHVCSKGRVLTAEERSNPRWPTESTVKLPELLGSRREYRISKLLTVTEHLNEKGEFLFVALDDGDNNVVKIGGSFELPVLLLYLEGLVKP